VPEVDLLMTALDDWWVPLVMLQADTGIRWGELMGLRVSSLESDPITGRENAWLSVRDTILEVTKADTGNGTPFMWKARPKGKRPRRIMVSPEVSAVLGTEIKARRLFGHDRLFSWPGSAGLPLRTKAWPDGRPVSRRTFLDIWHAAHDEAALPREGRRPHDVRGSHITWLLQAGVDVVTVMERVGHVNMSTTQGYTDPGKDAEGAARAAVAQLRARYRA